MQALTPDYTTNTMMMRLEFNNGFLSLSICNLPNRHHPIRFIFFCPVQE